MAKVGYWTVNRGKGNRIYIGCDERQKAEDLGYQANIVAHPEGLLSGGGMLIYGLDEAKDLAAAIIAFEMEEQAADSVEARAKAALEADVEDND